MVCAVRMTLWEEEREAAIFFLASSSFRRREAMKEMEVFTIASSRLVLLNDQITQISLESIKSVSLPSLSLPLRLTDSLDTRTKEESELTVAYEHAREEITVSRILVADFQFCLSIAETSSHTGFDSSDCSTGSSR